MKPEFKRADLGNDLASPKSCSFISCSSPNQKEFQKFLQELIASGSVVGISGQDLAETKRTTRSTAAVRFRI
ncbi:hypothetical protein GOBAR_DD29918 [Gossypium barbadense]|nr:hypothetical protein GOBAR_DD29918 [Gossypium barbadense]